MTVADKASVLLAINFVVHHGSEQTDSVDIDDVASRSFQIVGDDDRERNIHKRNHYTAGRHPLA